MVSAWLFFVPWSKCGRQGRVSKGLVGTRRGRRRAGGRLAGGPPSFGHCSVAGTKLGTENEGERLALWGKWAGPQTPVTCSDQCQEQGHRTRGRPLGGHSHLRDATVQIFSYLK